MTIYAFGRVVACRLFIKLCASEAEAEAFAARMRKEPPMNDECDGLQYPCGAPATHEVRELIGHDISGAPVVITAHYCDACCAEQASWEEDRP